MRTTFLKKACSKRAAWIQFAFVILMFTFAACTQPNMVTGYIKGLTNDTIYVSVSSVEHFNEDPAIDTVFAKNGRFKYTFPNDGMYILDFSFPQFFVHNRPSGGLYRPKSSRLNVFAEQSNTIHLKGEANSTGLRNVKVSGSKINRDFSYIQSEMLEIYANDVKEEMALEQAMEDGNKEAEDIGWENRRKRLKARNELYIDYIKTNPDNPLSAFLVFSLPFDSLNICDQLGENARNSVFRGALDNLISEYQNYASAMIAKEEVIEGKKAPDFILENIEGKPFALTSLRGKYVIIDFWGSWCGPCIVGIPKMKNAYDKYKNKLEIVGVACREKSVDDWKKAVKQHELPWINVYNDKSSSVNVKYGIEAFPTKIVIDPEGTILIRETGEGDGFYTKLESVLN